MTMTTHSPSVQSAIAEHYVQLSGALKAAADFIADNGFDVATRSLRSIATESDISPSSFSRLARAIGFDDYEQLRECARSELATHSNSFSSKAQKLHDQAVIPFLPRQVTACVSNIESLLVDVKDDSLKAAVDTLHNAPKVLIVGSLGSAAFADYFAYLTSWFESKWTVAGRNGVTLASSLMRLQVNDAVIIIAKSPYAKRSVLAAKMAGERGANVIVLTDSHTFPGIRHAKHAFIQKSESPQFFSSYAATLVLIETLVGMLVSQSGAQAVEEIKKVSEQNLQLEEFSQL